MTATPDRAAGIAAGRLAARYAAAGAPHPEVAAACVVARGRRRLDVGSFADLVGVPAHHVESWEAGRRPADHVPRRLAAVEPGLDWTAAGVPPAGDPTDPASRHPSAHRRHPPPPDAA